MPDLPFGFAAGDDRIPTSRRRTASPAPATCSGSAPAATRPTWADLHQLGQMFSGAGSAMSGGSSGPVNYDLARSGIQLIRFTAPVSAGTVTAITDAVHLADTWLDGATAHCRPAPSRAVAWTPTDSVDGTLETWKRLRTTRWPNRSPTCGPRRLPEEPRRVGR
jgi:uncharacterized protein (DUF2342 family)